MTDSKSMDLNPMIAEALALPSLAPDAVAKRLAEIGRLRSPTRPESVEFLTAILRYAAKEIPSVSAAWSWGEFHHAGIYPAHELIQADDPVGVAVCAADLGLTDGKLDPGSPTLRHALGTNLMEAADRLLRALQERLQAAGISTQAHRGLP